MPQIYKETQRKHDECLSDICFTLHGLLTEIANWRYKLRKETGSILTFTTDFNTQQILFYLTVI